MKKRVTSICIVLLTTLIILVPSVSISNAATKQLIIINSKYNTLNFYENNVLVQEFKCATGKLSTPTPQRKTTIVNKIKNRPYYKLGIPGGDPRNPLGKRWMGLDMYGYGTTYGIHGTNDESSIGKNISGGCIRMHNKDVEWLYDKIAIGATVIIKNTSNSDEWIANQYGIKISNREGWYEIDQKWYYLDSSGKKKTGWKQVNGSWYYLSEDGVMQTGWKQVNGSWYYLSEDGVMQTGWKPVNGSWYYLSEDGVMQTGWKQVNGSWYYLSEDGVMQTGWKQVNGSWYHLNDSGEMITNS